mgnify:CR=1 FL=1
MAQPRIVIVGAGVAGMMAALKLAPHPVLLVTAATLETEASSAWAQGGIAAVTSADDSIDAHIEDTLIAGAGLCDEGAVGIVAAEVPARIADLEAYGVRFARHADGSYDRAQEGAHRVRRVLHASADDGFGQELTSALARTVRNTASIELLENHIATALDAGSRLNAVALAPRDGGPAFWQATPALILATGGLGGLYRVTTNPLGSTGSGLALAGRIGAKLSDLEFVQFHPTGLDIGVDPAPLATESLRGDGAVLIDADGHRFMPGLDPRAELAPRDVVARGIFKARAESGGAFLDARDAIGDAFPQRFPTIFAALKRVELDPRIDPMPVAPAAHFHMGGIATDLWGQTTIPGLFAIGEVAATGVHGANRLASNSLAEAVVFAKRAADALSGAELPHLSPLPRTQAQGLAVISPEDNAHIQQLRAIMSDHVAVMRDRESLTAALELLAELPDTHPRLAAMRDVALWITRAALLRAESRGTHFRTDFPQADPDSSRSYLTPRTSEEAHHA